MAGEVIAAWIAAGASLAAAGVSWFAQKHATRTAAAAEAQTALVVARTDVWTSDKAIYVERVTAERGVWRSEMRGATATAVAWLYTADTATQRTDLHAALSGIALRLNPLGRSDLPDGRNAHPLDRDIFAVLADIRSSLDKPTIYPDLADRLERSVALLLKQEWMVSKREAKRNTLA